MLPNKAVGLLQTLHNYSFQYDRRYKLFIVLLQYILVNKKVVLLFSMSQEVTQS